MAASIVKPATTVESKSQHTSDPFLQPLLLDDFDPASYLNSTLPSLSTSSRIAASDHVPLTDLNARTQTLLSQLNAQTTRLSNVLTQLTDEIIRSGGRLAYEVDILKGETTGLTDALGGGLKRDFELFVTKQPSLPNEAIASEELDVSEGKRTEQKNASITNGSVMDAEPEYLQRLRTLTLVRSRLDSVIKTFGDAMSWPMAPSELQTSLISISAPQDSEDSRAREEKGKQHAEQLRADISDMIGDGNDVAGLEAAAQKVEQIRELAQVWKGTAEEKARTKLVESIQKVVEDQQRVLGKAELKRQPGVSPARGTDYRYGGTDSGYGFFQNLKSLGKDVYLD